MGNSLEFGGPVRPHSDYNGTPPDLWPALAMREVVRNPRIPDTALLNRGNHPPPSRSAFCAKRAFIELTRSFQASGGSPGRSTIRGHYRARELTGNSSLRDLRNNANDLHVNYYKRKRHLKDMDIGEELEAVAELLELLAPLTDLDFGDIKS